MPCGPEDYYATIRVVDIDIEGVQAHVFRTWDGTFYFCCETCGACGKHWHGADYALVQAAWHVANTDHTKYLEDHHGSDRP